MSNSKRKAEFRGIIDRLGITQAMAAEMISKKTERPLSARAVRAWLAKDAASSARPLPQWALDVMRSFAD